MRNESSRSSVEMFHVMDVLAASAQRVAEGRDVLSLAAGQPSTPAPAAVRAAAHAALDTEILGYTESVGLASLRATIAADYARRYGISVDVDDVVITTGSSGAFTLLFLAAFDAGDTVVMARPGYPAYRNTLSALGVRVVELDCGPQVGYRLTAAMLDELTEPPAGVIVASPANPTGTILHPEEIAELARWCDDHDTLLISDEIYHGISYGRATSCAWETSRQAAVVGSVSKYHSMTGWRLGWMLVPAHLRRPVERLTANMTICAPVISQYAALAAFGDEARTELDAHVTRYATNRAVLLEGLADGGLTEIAPPDGAFYIYADISHLTDDSLSWCESVLAETGVAIAPGVDFDTLTGHQTIRMSFAGSTETVRAALTRLEPVLTR